MKGCVVLGFNMRGLCIVVKLTKMYVILCLYDVVGALWSLLGTMVLLET